jgi:hypothetical protein
MERSGVYRGLVGKPEGKRPLVRPRRRWENIRADSHYASRFRSVAAPSSFLQIGLVLALSVVFSHLPAEHVMGSPRISPLNMQAHSFSKRQLVAIALMLDEEEKNASASDKKKRIRVQKCFRNRKLEGEYKELADDEIKFYQYFRLSKHQFNNLLQKSGNDLKKNTTFREAI